MLLHHQLKNRTEISAHVVLDTALHMGTSHQVSHLDSPVIRSSFGRCFIPGASLKGALRSRVEALAHTLNLPVCFLEKQNSLCLSGDPKGATHIQEKAESSTPTELSQYLEQNLCPACLLFGGSSWRSRVLFDDLHLLIGYSFPTELRDGVGIDRDSKTAVDSVKYDFEAVPAGSRFELKLMAENMSPKDWALLAIGLLELLNGHLALGGKTSRGLGSLHLENLRIAPIDFSDKKSLLLFFSGQIKTVDEPEKWLLEHLASYLSPSDSSPTSSVE
ncbi:CRISPR-associated RAMP protein Csx7 [Deltaproteobacteria bacterium TL4]